MQRWLLPARERRADVRALADRTDHQPEAKHQVFSICLPAAALTTPSLPATMASLLLIVFIVTLITHLINSVPAAALNELVRIVSHFCSSHCREHETNKPRPSSYGSCTTNSPHRLVRPPVSRSSSSARCSA